MLSDHIMELNFVRNKLETFQSSILRDVQKRMSGMIDEVMQELRQHELQSHEFRNFAKPLSLQQHTLNTWNNRRHSDTEETSKLSSTAEAITTSANAGNVEQTDNVDGGKSSTSVDRQISHSSTSDECNDGNKSMRSKKKLLRSFPEKVFRTRESYLTALLEVDHMKTIYHIFYIIFMIFCLNNITYDYLVNGR